MPNLEPYIIDFPKIGNSAQGYISLSEKELLPIEVKRIYWTYFTPEEIKRGHHAHYHLEQVLFAVAGTVQIKIETITGKIFDFNLDRPNIGVYIPKLSWRTMQYSHNAVQICLANKEYDEADYIRDYEEFKTLQSSWDGKK
ncbi:MAG: FdtA/QdtA family cupin domain-containing protein [Bacteroidota bacterium]